MGGRVTGGPPVLIIFGFTFVGSDDRTVKVWDLRNMRAPVTSIQTSAAVNRLSISPGGLIAIPQDNRHVVIHDLLNGQKLTRWAIF